MVEKPGIAVAKDLLKFPADLIRRRAIGQDDTQGRRNYIASYGGGKSYLVQLFYQRFGRHHSPLFDQSRREIGGVNVDSQDR